MVAIPLTSLHFFTDWREAPVGSLLSFGGNVMLFAHGHTPEELAIGPKIAFRAQTSQGLRGALVFLQPSGLLAYDESDATHRMTYRSIEALVGPAVDISEHMEIVVEPSPYVGRPHTALPPLTVIQTIGTTPITMFYAGDNERGAQFMVMTPEHKGKLVEGPSQQYYVVGTLAIFEKPKK